MSCIAQDDEGFIWIGTGDGLNRYDGYRVKNFFHSPRNENSVVNNSIFGIMPDGRNNLWITTREGVSFYNKKTGVFRNFRHNPADSTTLDNDQYASLYPDKNSSAWVATPTSIYYFDSLFRYKKILTSVNNINTVTGPRVELYGRLTADRQGNLWACKVGYLFLLDKKSMHIVKKFGPVNGNIESIYQDSNFQYWLGTFGGGLLRFDPETGKSERVKLAAITDVIHTVTEWRDKRGNRWVVVGSDHGIFLVDPISLRNKQYSFHLGDFPLDIVPQNDVQHVFVDNQNILWVGTGGGVCYAKPSHQLFDLWNISSSSDSVASTVSDWIYSLCKVPDGYWMTRWKSRGLYYFNTEGELTKSILSIQTPSGLATLDGPLKPYYIFNQGDSAIWFTTNECLVHYDPQSAKAIFFKPADAYDMTGLRTIMPLNEHSWWIRTRNNGPNGIYIFDPITQKFTKHFVSLPDCANCVPADLLTIYLTRKKEIYATGVGAGLFKYNPGEDNFTPVFRFQGKDLKQHSNSFSSIAEDNNGILWIATYSGLFALDPVSKKVVQDYSSNELIGGVDISGVLIDEQQNIWLNTERGMFYILHSTGQVRELTATAGLTNNSNGTFQQGEDRAIYNAIQGFVVRIYPSEVLNHRPQKFAVHFSEASMTDSPYFFRFTASGQKKMIIPPGQNRFSLDFSVMNYDGENRYYYKLDGVMDSWLQNENGHLAFYNLPPGNYTLHVKGGNEYGELPGNGDEVVIIVQPHWWQTDWFRIACGVVILALATLLIRRRIMRIRQEASFKQKMAETEMIALRSQMNPHFIFNSLNSIENFMMRNEKRLASSYLNKFARLIRMILDSSRNELVPITKDMEALQLYVDLEQLRFNNKFCYKVHVDQLLRDGDYKVPALLIQPYVENAIVHGLAHSEKDGLTLSVTALLANDYIHYTIQDNGVGRRQSSLYNHQNKPNHKSVGLTITEERIHIFNRKQNANGRVAVTDLFDENNHPSGTKVEITIKAV